MSCDSRCVIIARPLAGAHTSTEHVTSCAAQLSTLEVYREGAYAPVCVSLRASCDCERLARSRLSCVRGILFFQEDRAVLVRTSHRNRRY